MQCSAVAPLPALGLDGFGFCLMALLHTQHLFCVSLPAGCRCFVSKCSACFPCVSFILQGVVSVVELKQSSVVQRFLTGWMPTAIRLVFGGEHRELALFYDSFTWEEVVFLG